MKKIRIFCTYKTISDPWGGANNFLLALQEELAENHDITFASGPHEPYDVLFMNELGCGPGGQSRLMSFREFEEIRAMNENARLVVRAVNLARHSHPSPFIFYFLRGNFKKDRDKITLLHRADHVIFQSVYQKGFFSQAGYKGENDTVIHNGASKSFNAAERQAQPLEADTPLRIFSSSFSPRKTKRHDLIAALSLVPGVEIHYAGQWPKGLSYEKIRMLGVLTHGEMKDHLQQAHFFLHPALYDPCPNSMIEALCAGIPVLYNPGPGSGTELGGEFGVAIDEKNLTGTIKTARENYARLQSGLLERRSDFSIRRAAHEYAAVFRRALGL